MRHGTTMTRFVSTVLVEGRPISQCITGNQLGWSSFLAPFYAHICMYAKEFATYNKRTYLQYIFGGQFGKLSATAYEGTLPPAPSVHVYGLMSPKHIGFFLFFCVTAVLAKTANPPRRQDVHYDVLRLAFISLSCPVFWCSVFPTSFF